MLASYDRLNLEEALLYYWLAQVSFVEIKFILYHAALESLARSAPLNGSGVHVPQAVFDREVRPFLDDLEANHLDDPEWIRLLAKLRNDNQYGGARQLTEFLKALGLEIGKIEDEALDRRNYFAHGKSLHYTPADRNADLTLASQTLVNRAVLSLVGYKGQYVDLTTIGLPERNLNEKLGGLNGDGKL